MHGHKQLMSSAKTGGSDNYETPEKVLDIVRELYNGTIDLDPCTTVSNPTKANKIYTPAEDGLIQKWDGNAFCNPPYSKMPSWASKCAKEPANVILLCPARTDTIWWQENISTIYPVCYVKGRLKFKGQVNGAPFPSALVLFTSDPHMNSKFFKLFHKLGQIR